MFAQHSAPSHQEQAVEFLAHESHVPIGDVELLYGNELAKLEVGARIRSFLPILAIRKVRDLLRQQRR
jgi:hypothetical protein